MGGQGGQITSGQEFKTNPANMSKPHLYERQRLQTAKITQRDEDGERSGKEGERKKDWEKGVRKRKRDGKRDRGG